MNTTFKAPGISYIRCGDYFIPELGLPEEHRPIGRWGRLRREYLREQHPVLFQQLVLSCQLWTHLADVNEQVTQRLEIIIEQMKKAEGITEQLKAADFLHWVGAMNSIRSRAEEIVLSELVYSEEARG